MLVLLISDCSLLLSCQSLTFIREYIYDQLASWVPEAGEMVQW